jgi:hypothetical protein
MFYYIIKVLISAVLIVLISEIAKRSTLIGGILASVPLISVLSFVWLYFETQNVEKIASLSYSVFILVIPSLILFLILPVLLRMKVHFFLSLFISIAVTAGFYYILIAIFQKLGIKI